jgi:hypothetical protein
VHKANAVVDRARLDFFNTAHLKRHLLSPAPAASTRMAAPSSTATAAAAAAAVVAAATISKRGKPHPAPAPVAIADTHALARIRSSVLPRMQTALAALSGSGDSRDTEWPVPFINAVLVAQHERVTVLPDYVPLLLPFLCNDTTEYARLLLSDTATAALQRLVAPKAAAPAASDAAAAALAAPMSAAAATRALFQPLMPLLSDVATAWVAQEDAEFGDAGGAVAAISKVAKSHSTPPGRLMLALRWVLTGLDAGCAMTDTLRLLTRPRCIARVHGFLAAQRANSTL